MRHATATLLVASLWGAACVGSEPMPEPASRPTPVPLPPGLSLGADHPKTEHVSLVRVLAEPASVNGKAITVDGYFDSGLLCLHEEDAAKRLRTNCVSIEVSDSPQARALNQRYVVVSGVVGFGGRTGLSPIFDLVIKDVRRMDPIKDRDAMAGVVIIH